MKNLFRVGLPTVLLLGVAGAHAAVPSTVTDALTSASTDASTVAGLVVAIIVAIAAFKFMRRAIS